MSDGGYVIISGAVALDSSQNAAKATKIVGQGSLLGELALLVSTKNSATAIARQNTSSLKISRAMFLRTLEESPVSAGRLKRLLSRELEAFSKDLEATRRKFLD
jgi:CRP-like cAMP-binding protein